MGKIKVDTVTITCRNWDEELKNFIETFDADVTGLNGEEYTIDEAKEQGFSCSVDYWINEATGLYNYTSEINDVCDMVCHVLGKVAETYSEGANFDVYMDVMNDMLAVAFCSI